MEDLYTVIATKTPIGQSNAISEVLGIFRSLDEANDEARRAVANGNIENDEEGAEFDEVGCIRFYDVKYVFPFSPIGFDCGNWTKLRKKRERVEGWPLMSSQQQCTRPLGRRRRSPPLTNPLRLRLQPPPDLQQQTHIHPSRSRLPSYQLHQQQAPLRNLHPRQRRLHPRRRFF